MIIECCKCKKYMGIKEPYGNYSVTSTYCWKCEKIEYLKLDWHILKYKIRGYYVRIKDYCKKW
jgi:hypothetical protein